MSCRRSDMVSVIWPNSENRTRPVRSNLARAIPSRRGACYQAGVEQRSHHAADERPDDVDENARVDARDNHRSQGTGRVARFTADRAAQQHARRQGKADGQRGAAGWYARVDGHGGDRKNQEESDQRFDWAILRQGGTSTLTYGVRPIR